MPSNIPSARNRLNPWFGLPLHGLVMMLGCVLLGCGPADPQTAAPAQIESPITKATRSFGIVVSSDQVNETNLIAWKEAGNAVALKIDRSADQAIDVDAANAIKNAGLELGYFFEVAHCPELATAHPEWLCSLQGHPEWRKQFPDVPIPNARQVVKNHPWVPILYRESFDAHLLRIKGLLAKKPTPARIWLNDLQAGPSACGCGHPLCRWTADYGPIKTATPLGADAAAQFVAAVKKLAPTSQVIPIFVGECEREDKDTVCCGVGCFEGKCWKDFTRQLDELASESSQIGVACFYREFERDLPRYKQPAGWIRFTLDSFSSMPAQRGGTGVPEDRLIAILQGWDVTTAQLDAQIERVRETDASGYLVSMCRIDQTWQPIVVDLPSPELKEPNQASRDE